MIPFLIDFLAFLRVLFRSRYSLGLEILTLRQPLGVLKRKQPRPRLLIKVMRYAWQTIAQPLYRNQNPMQSNQF